MSAAPSHAQTASKPPSKPPSKPNKPNKPKLKRKPRRREPLHPPCAAYVLQLEEMCFNIGEQLRNANAAIKQRDATIATLRELDEIAAKIAAGQRQQIARLSARCSAGSDSQRPPDGSV